MSWIDGQGRLEWIEHSWVKSEASAGSRDRRAKLAHLLGQTDGGRGREAGKNEQ